MKLINIILFLFLFSLLSGQWHEIYDMNDIEDLNTYTTNDSFAFIDDDIIYVAGADTIVIYVPVRYSRGAMHFRGMVTADDSLIHPDYGDTSTYSGGDTIYFDLAVNTGSGDRNTNETETFYAMDSIKINSGIGSFEFWPMANTNLQSRAAVYYSFRIRGTANNLGKIVAIIEYINSIPKRY